MARPPHLALVGIAILCALPSTGSAVHPEPPLWPAEIDTLHVTADRPSPEERLRQRTGFSTLVPLGADAPADRDLGDLLDRTAGIHVHRYGGSGSFSLASVRGSTPGQVKVAIDGVPIAAAADGSVNLSNLPLASFQHVEIYRGAQTESFGGPPAAGVINLVTDADVALRDRVSIGVGSYGARNAAAHWSRAIRPIRALVSGEYRTADGDFPFHSNNGTPFNPDDDHEAKRRNNDVEALHLLWKTSIGDRDRAWADYTGIYSNAENGVPGQKNLQADAVRYRSRRHRHQISARWRPSDSVPVRLKGTAHLLRVRDRFENPEAEVGLSRAKTDDRTREEGARFSAAAPVPSLRQRPRVMVETRRERFTPRNELKNETGDTRNRRQRTIAIEDQLTLGHVRLEAAYRWVRSTY
ncbi:MAG: TonB-dependent receptor plug domain-containing protein, partial [Candidatus Eisenbacteria bacterium]|nr:TonB-dependent receptor plug domain-containing protein [Candidatus Latescibacterota bacterium]MBD3302772.1 TonB-dependent receptor plug domain-containing protein [Candidatus Eisenbacteria bacterium]